MKKVMKVMSKCTLFNKAVKYSSNIMFDLCSSVL